MHETDEWFVESSSSPQPFATEDSDGTAAIEGDASNAIVVAVPGSGGRLLLLARELDKPLLLLHHDAPPSAACRRAFSASSRALILDNGDRDAHA